MNLFLVMLVSGLWHGAGWTFILWGVMHGLVSCANKAIGKRIVPKWIAILINFIVVTLLWVVFRAETIANAIDVFKGMFIIHGGISQPFTWSFFSLALLIGATIAMRIKGEKIEGVYPVMDLSRFWNLVTFFVFCGLTVIMAYFGNTSFIYGKF